MNKIRFILNLFLPSLNLVLESFGYGIKWEYFEKEVEFKKSTNHTVTIKLLCRKNPNTGDCYYRTMRPMSQGYDGNEWVRFNSKNFEIKKKANV